MSSYAEQNWKKLVRRIINCLYQKDPEQVVEVARDHLGLKASRNLAGEFGNNNKKKLIRRVEVFLYSAERDIAVSVAQFLKLKVPGILINNKRG